MSIARPKDLQRRLLKDIAELQNEPYPNIHLHIDDADIDKACLILTPECEKPLHLTVRFPPNYPLKAPQVSIQTPILHPNVYGDYICASILNTSEDWTPAYALKAIAIQLLSFFSSEYLEQVHSGRQTNIEEWRIEIRTSHHLRRRYNPGDGCFECHACGFGQEWPEEQSQDGEYPSDGDAAPAVDDLGEKKSQPTPEVASKLLGLPDEILLLTLAEMDTRDVLTLASAAPSIARVVRSYDFIRVRELQCFCFKKSFFETKLGVGVAISGSHKRPVFRSEFDLLSQEAFFQNKVDYSIQGVKFDRWLPLPLNRRHWRLVQTTVGPCLKGIQAAAGMDVRRTDAVDVLYCFMNSVVVQFSADYERGACNTKDRRSTLNCVSEKAVEAYFALFHLLLCLATEDPSVVVRAKETISRFLSGPRTKAHFPDLGHVLIAALIAGAEPTQGLTLAIIKEAILRNVVWMLDSQGADMAELAYLEPSAVSDYRLATTFSASKTSYRLLMFLRLFSRAARPPNKSLIDLREALFDTHGAPPAGITAMIAERMREIHAIDGFPQFLAVMGIKEMPSKTQFTAFLRRSITDSVAAGYSKMPMSQSQLYMVRRVWEPRVEVAEGVRVTGELVKWFEKGEKWHHNGWKGRPSFFPSQRNGGRAAREGTRGRGRGRGRGRS
jgi:ubiquitin-protein ligase